MKKKKKSVAHVFKIIDTKTGLYSTGGSHPRWTTTGKTWSSLGQIKSHLTQYEKWYSKDRAIPLQWEVVVFRRAPVNINLKFFRAVALNEDELDAFSMGHGLQHDTDE